MGKRITLYDSKAAPIGADKLIGTDSVDGSVKNFLVSDLLNSTVNRYCYLPRGWDVAWEAAKAASVTTPAKLLVYGDSFLAGFGSTDIALNSVPSLLKAALIARGYGWHADFWPTNMSENWWASAYPGTAPWLVSTDNDSWYPWGLTHLPLYTGAATDALTFTTPYACTAFDFIYSDSTAHTWKYAIDGGGQTTVTATGSSDRVKIAVSGLANTAHTVVCGDQNADNSMQVDGITTYTGTAGGISLARCAWPGARTEYCLSISSNVPAVKALQWQGKYTGHATGLGFPTQPHLAIIGLGLNDCANTFAVASFLDYLRRFILALRRGVSDCSILLMVMANPDPVYSDITSGHLAHADAWPTYVESLYSLASTFGCGLINMESKWGPDGYTKGFIAVDTLHPVDAGHTDMANMILSVI